MEESDLRDRGPPGENVSVPLTSLSRKAFWNLRWWSESKLWHGEDINLGGHTPLT